MGPNSIEDVLVGLHSGQWFGWSNSKNKIYDNLVIYTNDDKPAKEWLEAELKRQQELYKSKNEAKEQLRTSVINKIATNLTSEEKAWLEDNL